MRERQGLKRFANHHGAPFNGYAPSQLPCLEELPMPLRIKPDEGSALMLGLIIVEVPLSQDSSRVHTNLCEPNDLHPILDSFPNAL